MSEVTTFKIHSLELKNFRAFELLNIDFHDKLSVIVAKNGIGKTSILDAIAVAIGPFIGSFTEAVGKHFAFDDIRMFKARETESNEMEYAAGGVSLSAKGRFNHKTQISWKRELSAPKKAKTTIKNAKILIEIGKSLQESVQTKKKAGESETLLPIIAYYGTGRLWQMQKLTESRTDRTSRMIGYADCLNPGSSFRTFADWFKYWSESKWRPKMEAMRLGKVAADTEFDQWIASVNHAVSICLRVSGWQALDYSIARQELVGIHPQNGELPISLLSDGVRSMIALVADIAFRATKLNPHLGAEASHKTPGIVLIDEVDMHLHPEWQQLVLSGLTEAFPEIQFIVTTHSPQVLTTVPPECIRELVRDGDVLRVVIPEFSLGAESPYVLETIQGVNTRPQHLEIVKELNEYQQLITEDQWDIPRALELREKLHAWGHGFEPALVKMDMDIRMRAYRRGKAAQ